MLRLAVFFVLIALVLAGCAGRESAPVVQTSPPTTATTLPAATTTLAPAPTTTTSSTVAAPRRFTSGVFAVAFTIVRPEGTTLTQSASDDVFYLEQRTGENEYLILTTRGPSTLDEWRAVQAEQPMDLSETKQAEIGGVACSYLEFTTVGSHEAPGQILFTFEPGDTGRVYVVDVNGEAVTIIAVAGADRWDAFESQVDQMIDGFTWG
ncbi:MAG: hypothetical protein OEO77_00525 [Acidimicrobiia bacterium]|nr:hypothetical protein [Acidimicrobiia bacterium]